MAITIPTIEPAEITVGDRVQWTKTLPDFPATSEGWTLTYYLRANVPGGTIDIVASASVNDYSVDVAPAVSALWTPAVYFWESYVSKSGDRKKAGEGRIELLPNFSAIELPYDGRSHARRCLESIEAVIEGRATRDDLKYAFSAVGRSVEKMPTADLIMLRDYYLTEVKSEEAKANLLATGSTGRNVLIRFT